MYTSCLHFLNTYCVSNCIKIVHITIYICTILYFSVALNINRNCFIENITCLISKILKIIFLIKILININVTAQDCSE